MPKTKNPVPLSGSLPEPLAFTNETEFRAVRRQWEDAVQRDAEIGPAERLVLLRLATYCGWDTPAWPSAVRLGDELGMSLRAVRRALAAGRKRGWIVPTGRRGFASTQTYLLAWDATIVHAVESRTADLSNWRDVRRRQCKLRIVG
jgi:hypothetical protein